MNRAVLHHRPAHGILVEVGRHVGEVLKGLKRQHAMQTPSCGRAKGGHERPADVDLEFVGEQTNALSPRAFFLKALREKRQSRGHEPLHPDDTRIDHVAGDVKAPPGLCPAPPVEACAVDAWEFGHFLHVGMKTRRTLDPATPRPLQSLARAQPLGQQPRGFARGLAVGEAVEVGGFAFFGQRESGYQDGLDLVG